MPIVPGKVVRLVVEPMMPKDIVAPLSRAPVIDSDSITLGQFTMARSPRSSSDAAFFLVHVEICDTGRALRAAVRVDASRAQHVLGCRPPHGVTVTFDEIASTPARIEVLIEGPPIAVCDFVCTASAMIEHAVTEEAIAGSRRREREILQSLVRDLDNARRVVEQADRARQQQAFNTNQTITLYKTEIETLRMELCEARALLGRSKLQPRRHHMPVSGHRVITPAEVADDEA